MSTANPPTQVPAIIRAKLCAVRRRERFVSVLRGLLRSLAALLVFMMFAMVVDWTFTLFNHGVRTGLTVTTLAIAVLGFCGWFFWPLLTRRGLTAVAQDIDEAVPRLEERWSTVTELSVSDEPPQRRGSETLIRRVTDEAVDRAELVAASRVVERPKLHRWEWAMLGIAALLLLAMITDPSQMRVLMQRYLSPQTNITLTRVASVTGDTVVGKNEPLTIEAQLDGRKRDQAALVIRSDDAEPFAIPLVRAAEGEVDFAYTIRAVSSPFDYRVRSGDGQTIWHHVAVRERPRIEDIAFRITPPEYSELPVQEPAALPRRARALEGSRLEVAFRSTQPLASMQLQLGKDQFEAMTPVGDRWYRYEKVLTENITFLPMLQNEYGLTNRNPPRCHVTVYPDRPPVVEVVSPADEITVRPEDVVPIEFEAADDFGIDSAELLVFEGNLPEGEPVEVIPIDLGEQKGSKAVHATAELDLKQFDLEHGSELTYVVQVTDTKQTAAVSSQSPQTDQALAELDSAASTPQTAESQAPSAEEQAAAEQKALAEASSEQADSTAPQSPSAAQQAAAEQKASAQKSSQPSGSDPPMPPSALAMNIQDQQPSDPGERLGAEPPQDDMTKRSLNIPGQCAACSPKHLKIDEYIGSFEGQARDKLTIAIDQFIKRLDDALKQAAERTDALLQHIDTDKAWQAAQSTELDSAREDLAEADRVIVELVGVSKDTPYALIGLQLKEIGASHIDPARSHLGEALPPQLAPDIRSDRLTQASYHIHRAREMLAGLIRQYEQVKQKEEKARELQNLARMYRLYLEDMAKLLGSSKPALNQFDRKIAEVDEEFVESLRELLEQKKKMLAELAKALADDPRLLRRFMAMQRLEGTTLRDQLTLLARRQRTVHSQLAAWVAADDPQRAVLIRDVLSYRVTEQYAIVNAAAQMVDNMATWVPLDVEPGHPKLQELQEVGLLITRTSQDAMRHLATGNVDSAIAAGREALTRLRTLLDELPQVEQIDENNAKLAVYAANRSDEATDLAKRQSAWLQKVEALHESDYLSSAGISQRHLFGDTVELAGKLDVLPSMVANTTEEIVELAERLARTVNEEVTPAQMKAQEALDERKLDETGEHQREAVAAFARAETQADEFMEKLIEYLDSLPPPTGGGATPSAELMLEKLLAMLEDEMKACEKLGIPCRPLNVQVMSDWMMPGQGSGSGSGQGQGQMPANSPAQQLAQSMQRTELTAQQLEQMQQLAEALANQTTQEFQQQVAQAIKAIRARRDANGDGDGDGGSGPGDGGVDQRIWDTLVSQLADGLRQQRGNNPPEQYRRPIEEYFERIAEDAAAQQQ